MRHPPSDTGMSVDRIAELTDRHGAELSHWPSSEAHAARRLLAGSAEARTILARARHLDRILGETPLRSATVGLRDRLLAAAPERGWRELLRSLWPFGPVWRPAAALVGLALAGVFLGSSDAASLTDEVSVNGALSEEIQMIALSAVEILDAGARWQK